MTLTLSSRSRAACAILWVALIFYSSTTQAERICDRLLMRLEEVFLTADRATDDGTLDDRFWAKKTAHVVLFVTLAFLLSGAVTGRTGTIRLFIASIAAAVGCGSELLQLFFVGREPQLRDAALNAASGALGAMLFVRPALEGARSSPHGGGVSKQPHGAEEATDGQRPSEHPAARVHSRTRGASPPDVGPQSRSDLDAHR